MERHTSLATSPLPHLDEYDAIAEAIAALCCHFGEPRTAVSLTAGIGLAKGRSLEEHIPRLAMRAGFSCTPLECPLDNVTPFVLPALLLLHNDEACVLLAKNGSQCEILIAKTHGIIHMELSELMTLFAERAYTLQPDATRTVPAGISVADQQTASLNDWLWAAFRDNKWIYLQASLGSLLINLFSIPLALFTMLAYNSIFPAFAEDSLWVLGSGVILVAVAHFVVGLLRSQLMDIAGRRIDVVLGNRLFFQLLQQRMNQRGTSAGVTANVVRELDVLRDFMNSSTLSLLSDVPFLIIFLIVLWWIGGIVVLVPLLTIPVVFAITLIPQKRLHEITTKIFKEASHRNAVLFEILYGMETIKANGAESWAAHKWETGHAAGIKSSFELRQYVAFNYYLQPFVQTVNTIILIVWAFYLLKTGDMSLGALIAAMMLNSKILTLLAGFTGIVHKLHGAKIAFNALDELVRKATERDENSQFFSFREVMGKISFDKVDFSYDIAGVAPDKITIKNIEGCSFIIQPGERVGIVGTIGAGKSTLLKLMLNLYQPTSGSIRLDELEVRQLDPADVRHAIGYVPQNPHFFRGTIRDNIVLQHVNASDKEVLLAADIAGVTQWLSRCPLGFAQPIGERGEALSGGQRQSIALARALLLQPPILLLDEPTSLLDSISEAHFVRQMGQLAYRPTLIITTHRPALLELVERIIVMDKGKVVLDGPKTTVLAQLTQGVGIAR